jgi:hypothetical protein
MKEERDVIKEAPTKKESKIHKYMRIALLCIFIALMGLIFYRMVAKKFGW